MSGPVRGEPASQPSQPTSQPARHNPYRGPREFRRQDKLPNRQREASRLADCLVAERVVLLHAPSGAGKTSLIEAGVVGRLIDEGFWPTPRLRVNQPLRDGRVRNRYIHSLATYLLSERNGTEPAGGLTLDQAIARWRESAPRDQPTVLIIDQLEEILTLDPTDWEAKEAFFRELGAVLKAGPVWALLAMREDYMGGLDRFLRFLPGLLRARYRLDFLSGRDAILAMQVPAERQRVEFTTKAAEALVNRLTEVQVQRPGEQPEVVKAPYVEPVQLQVVCRMLWKNIRKHEGDDFSTIGVAQVERYADVDRALMFYFGTTVTAVAKTARADERTIRDWFQFCLITKQLLRNQTLSAPRTGDPQRVLHLLEEGYLIRGDMRGVTWYELAHDRLIGAVLASNVAWRQENLESWQIAAYEWNARDRDPTFLLPVGELPKHRELTNADLTDLEREFLEAVTDMERRRGVLAWRHMISGLAVAEFIVIIVLVILLIASLSS